MVEVVGKFYLLSPSINTHVFEDLVQDDERLPKRRAVGGKSNWRVWPKDVRLSNAEKSILGPVVDRKTREILFFRTNDCDISGICGEIVLLIAVELA